MFSEVSVERNEHDKSNSLKNKLVAKDMNILDLSLCFWTDPLKLQKDVVSVYHM
jgi:hypothetical protein